LVSNKTLANNAIPSPFDSLNTIISKFDNVGLSVKDVVTLSGIIVYNQMNYLNFEISFVKKVTYMVFCYLNVPIKEIQSDVEIFGRVFIKHEMLMNLS